MTETVLNVASKRRTRTDTTDFDYVEEAKLDKDYEDDPVQLAHSRYISLNYEHAGHQERLHETPFLFPNKTCHG